MEKEVTKTKAKSNRFKVFSGGGGKKQGAMDMFLFNMVLVLFCFGLIMCFSASAPEGQKLHGDSYHFIRSQFLYGCVGIIGMLVASHFDYHKYRKYLWIIVIGTIALLIATQFFPPINGSQRWIKVGPVTFQPSEFAKFTAILWVAFRLSRQKWNLNRTVKDFFLSFVTDIILPYGIMLGIFAILLMLQPPLP